MRSRLFSGLPRTTLKAMSYPIEQYSSQQWWVRELSNAAHTKEQQLAVGVLIELLSRLNDTNSSDAGNFIVARQYTSACDKRPRFIFSDTPFVHASREAAETEARRLSRSRDADFAVLKRVSVASSEELPPAEPATVGLEELAQSLQDELGDMCDIAKARRIVTRALVKYARNEEEA